MPQKFFVSKKRWSSYHTAQLFKSFHFHKSRCLRSNYIHMYYLSIQKHFNVSTKLWSICIRLSKAFTYTVLLFTFHELLTKCLSSSLNSTWKFFVIQLASDMAFRFFQLHLLFQSAKSKISCQNPTKFTFEIFSVCGICPVLIPQPLYSQNQISSMQI